MINEEKIHELFSGFIVRKDLSKLVKGNALVPTYVLEYLLGQYCATKDEATTEQGIEKVKEILAKHYVNRSENQLVLSWIKERGHYRIIDRVTVALNDAKGTYEAVFANLGIKKVIIESDYIKNYPKLLVGGVWCIVDLEYRYEEDREHVPWVIENLKPIQIARADLDEFIEARKQFDTEAWIDFIVRCLGFNPDAISERNKWYQLVRLIPFCENNYSLIELGPKGTGKSHVYSEFSPHGILISGGEVTLAKLFVNNSTNKIGLVGYWDVVAFDEFAGKSKQVDKTLVDVMKNYMANRSFSRGTEQLTADASIVFVGNTSKSVSYMLKHENLFMDLPDKYLDSAFIDRLHFYIPGWEVAIIRNEMFTADYGFIVDYLAQILKMQRSLDYSDAYRKYFELDLTLSVRDKMGINKTFSGLMKIIYPHREATKEEIEKLLAFAMEGRKRIKMEIFRIDPTFDPVRFAYKDLQTGEIKEIKTAEELKYPMLTKERLPSPVQQTQAINETATAQIGAPMATAPAAAPAAAPEKTALPTHFTVAENQTGICFRDLFAGYLRGAHAITIVDPYIRKQYQIRNLVEFMQVVLDIKPEGEEISVHLITDYGEFNRTEIDESLRYIQDDLRKVDIDFTYEFDETRSIHARSITTDTGWKIILDRGLDIFQRFEGGLLSLAGFDQRARYCKAFEITYVRDGKEPFGSAEEKCGAP
ncbi:MAG: BREX system Lon protease-like protein BrxL [Rectinema subterraneum]|jgi:ATP-dependent Lon protease